MRLSKRLVCAAVSVVWSAALTVVLPPQTANALPSIGSETRNAPVDTLRLGALRRNPGYYHHVQSVGARVQNGVRIQLHGLSIPIVATSGSHVTVRLFGNERDAAVPHEMRDLIAPLVVAATSDGPQTLNVEFESPVAIDGAQFFIVLDSVSDGCRIITTTERFADTCHCSSATYTQQVIRELGSWKTAPHTFPWELRFSKAELSSSIRFKLDTLRSSTSAVHTDRFFLQVGDLNADNIPDLLTPSGLFIGKGSRQFIELKELAPQLNVGAWTVLQPPDNALLHVIPGKGVGNDTLLAVARGIPSVRVRQVHSGEAGVVKAAWPIYVKQSVQGNETQYVAILTQDTSSHSNNAVVTIAAATQDHFDPVSNSRLDVQGSIETVAAWSNEAKENFFSMIVKTPDGLEHLNGRIDDDTLVVTNRLIDVSTYFNIAGPGLGFLGSDEGHSFVSPVQTLPSRQRAASTSREPAVYKYEPADAWDSERRASVAAIDLDLDGTSELILPTSDTCHPIHVVRSTGANGGNSIFEPLDAAGLQILSGSIDVADGDLDGDGKPELIGLRNGRIVVLWNESASAVPSGLERDVTDPKLSANVTLRGLGVSRYGSSVKHPTVDAMRADRTTVPSVLVEVVPSVFDQACHIRVRTDRDYGPMSIAISSIDGQEIKRWNGVESSERLLSIDWDGHDASGVAVGSGTYVVTVTTSLNKVVTYTQKVR